ncbi:hypothetical protein LTR66_013650 [Elasticomyces elasticus]|nr:hypothetical protein LTR66_013650 [Elasticomyces elasticus]
MVGMLPTTSGRSFTYNPLNSASTSAPAVASSAASPATSSPQKHDDIDPVHNNFRAESTCRRLNANCKHSSTKLSHLEFRPQQCDGKPAVRGNGIPYHTVDPLTYNKLLVGCTVLGKLSSCKHTIVNHRTRIAFASYDKHNNLILHDHLPLHPHLTSPVSDNDPPDRTKLLTRSSRHADTDHEHPTIVRNPHTALHPLSRTTTHHHHHHQQINHTIHTIHLIPIPNPNPFPIPVPNPIPFPTNNNKQPRNRPTQPLPLLRSRSSTDDEASTTTTAAAETEKETVTATMTVTLMTTIKVGA